MITIDGKQLRNLQEQVLQNQQDIQYLLHEGGVLNEFGIKVVGQVNTVAELPDPTAYEGEYGDAYAVGTETPYTFYIWTRQISGQTGSFWFNVGQFPAPSTVPGPPGETGVQGPPGPRGSVWSSQGGAPSTPGNNGDQALDTNTGDIYQYVAATSSWQRTGNISGPTGPQGPVGPVGPEGPVGPVGPEGPVGPAGQFIEIVGVLQNTDQLPMIDSVPRSNAYAIPNAAGVEHVWYIIGDGTTENPYTWHDGGVVGGGGTQVTLNGTPQETIELGKTPGTLASMEITSGYGSMSSEYAVAFGNTSVEYTTPGGQRKTEGNTTIRLPIGDSEEILRTVIDDGYHDPYIGFTLSSAYKQSVTQQIGAAGVKWVTITAASTATSGTLTVEQLQVLQSANMSGIIFNNKYYLRSGDAKIGNILFKMIYTSVIGGNISTITVTIGNRQWDLTTNTNQLYLHTITVNLSEFGMDTTEIVFNIFSSRSTPYTATDFPYGEYPCGSKSVYSVIMPNYNPAIFVHNEEGVGYYYTTKPSNQNTTIWGYDYWEDWKESYFADTVTPL